MKLANQTIYNWLATQVQIVGIWRDNLVDTGMHFSDPQDGFGEHDILGTQEQADTELLDCLETHYNWLSGELVRLRQANGSDLGCKLN